MGFFNSRAKDADRRKTGTELPQRRVYRTDAEGKPMQLRHPHSFADVEEIIDRLKDKLTVIVYLNELSDGTATRVLDMLSGAIYALNGSIRQISKNIFLFAPSGVTITVPPNLGRK